MVALAPCVGPVASAVTDGLRAADGRTNQAMAPARGTNPNQVGRGRRRWAERGREGMAREYPRGGHRGASVLRAKPNSEARGSV